MALIPTPNHVNSPTAERFPAKRIRFDADDPTAKPAGASSEAAAAAWSHRSLSIDIFVVEAKEQLSLSV
jgi:hypothetical protein